MQDKYVVYKKTADNVRSFPLTGDFFVVREQDVFAPQLLYGYAHTINTFLEGCEAMGVEVADGDYLRGLADDLMEKADKWRFNRDNKKIPD